MPTKILTKKNITILLKKMMISGKRKERELLGLSLIKKSKMLNIVRPM